MQDISKFLSSLTQHEKLVIRVSSHSSANIHGQITDEMKEIFMQPHRKIHYFFQFIKRGYAVHKVDLQDVNISAGQLLFVLPHQIHQPPPYQCEIEHYKVIFDEQCLSLLPKSFPFLVNPLQHQLITIKEDATQRISWIFESLSQLLSVKNSPTTLILSHLDSLLTEINHAYFQGDQQQPGINDKMAKFIAFKLLVEAEFTQHPSIEDICRRLAVNTTFLYNIVKQFSALSPKEFLNQRLILEAQRKLYYGEASVKEIAFELGFNDPDYFSRLFRKTTGRTISQFAAELKDLSGS